MNGHSMRLSVRRTGLAVLTALCAAGRAFASDADATNAAPWSAARLGREVCGDEDWAGFNRSMFWIGDKTMTYIADPLCRVYCSVVPRPLVKGIDNAVENSEYPVRLVSTLLRSEWGAAWDETRRFGINTTVGLGGLFDPAKNWCGIVSTDASMSGTLAAWGVPKGPAIVLPFVPRANVRDVSGYVLDQGLDPKTYIDIFFPTDIGLGWSAAFWPNYAAVWIDPWEEIVTPSADPYTSFRQLISASSLLGEDLSVYRYATDALAGRATPRRPPVRAVPEKPSDLRGRWRDIPGYAPRTPALDSIRARIFAPRRDNDFWWDRKSVFNRDFAKDVAERSVTIATNLPAARYGFVPAPDTPNSSLVTRTSSLFFVIPGVGGTYASKATLAMGELLHEAGAAVVLCDDPFHWQYMLSANRGLLPGNLPEDTRRFAEFVRVVLADLKAAGLVVDPEVSVVGWSMGGLFTAHLAALERHEDLGFRTGALLAINPPVSFASIESSISSFLAPSRNWSADEAKTNFVEIASRLAVWDKTRAEPTPDISETDAQYTVAVALGTTLPGLVAQTTHTLRDVDVHAYFCRHVCAQYPEKDVETLAREAGLHSLEDDLRASTRLAVIHSWDDFLLTDADRDWFDRTFGDRLTWFSVGGHCGYFHTPEFRSEVLEALCCAENGLVPINSIIEAKRRLLCRP